MLKCKACTAGITEYFNPNSTCYQCKSVLDQICVFCHRSSNQGLLTMTCSKCRPHMCLSKCASGCVLLRALPPPSCRCPKSRALKFRVTKEGDNQGRWFWTCRMCNYFEFEEDSIPGRVAQSRFLR